MTPPIPTSSEQASASSSSRGTNTIGRVIPRCVVIVYYDADDEVKTADASFIAKRFGVLSENVVNIKVELTTDPNLIVIFVVFKTTEIATFVSRKAKQVIGDKDIELIPSENWLIESAKYLSSMKVHTAESAYHMFYERNKRETAVKPPVNQSASKPPDNANLFELLKRQHPQTVDVNVHSGVSTSPSVVPSSSNALRNHPTTSTSKNLPPVSLVSIDPQAWLRQQPPQQPYPPSAGPYHPYQQPTVIGPSLNWASMSMPPFPAFGGPANPMFSSNQGPRNPMFPNIPFTPHPANGFFNNAESFNGYPHPFANAQQFQSGPRPQQQPPNKFNQFDSHY